MKLLPVLLKCEGGLRISQFNIINKNVNFIVHKVAKFTSREGEWDLWLLAIKFLSVRLMGWRDSNLCKCCRLLLLPLELDPHGMLSYILYTATTPAVNNTSSNTAININKLKKEKVERL